jgi:hypothetical protein
VPVGSLSGMMLRKLALSLLALGVAVAVTPRASAQPEGDVAQARELFREGSKLAEAGSWEQARDRFERSIKLKRAALTLYNLGVAQQETGRMVAAIDSFRAFLAQPTEPATQHYVEPVRVVLGQLEARVGRLAIEVQPANLRGLVVRVDGREVPPAAGASMIDPGRHEIVAVAPGYAEARQTTTVAEGTRATLALWLAPAPVSPAPPPSVALPAALTVGGLALFAAGEIAFGAGARQGIGSPSDARSARTTMLAGNIVEGAGVLAAGIGIILFVTRAAAPAKKVAVSPWATGNVGGVKVRF